MDSFLFWWETGLSRWVKTVYIVIVLLLNGVPAFFILTSIPSKTDHWFVWTVKPEASVRLLAVMYGNALLLVVLGLRQSTWPRARITVLVITLFAISATVITFLNLTPFRKHPWYHLTYWLSMYLILVFLAPFVFRGQERQHGGRLPVETEMPALAHGMAAFCILVYGLIGLGLIFSRSRVNRIWPWTLTPLVAAIIGVWLSTLAVAFAWALWDGDWLRIQPIIWQAIPTGIGLALIPLVHSDDLHESAAGRLVLYLTMALEPAAASLVLLLTRRQGLLIGQARA